MSDKQEQHANPKYKSTWLVEARFRCEACGKEWGGRNAQAVAARHHDSTGHTVRGEIYLAAEYSKRTR